MFFTFLFYKFFIFENIHLTIHSAELGNIVNASCSSLVSLNFPFWSVFLDFPGYFLNIPVDPVGQFLRFFFKGQEPSSVWFSVLPRCQECYLSLIHLVKISTTKILAISAPAGLLTDPV